MGTRSRSAIVGLVLIFVGGCGQKAPIWQNATWQEFRSGEGRFTALFPGTPQPKTQTVFTAIGNVTAFMYMVDSSDGAVGVMYADYPPALVQQGDVTKMLDGARDGAIANVKGKLVEESRSSLQGAPGREYLIQIKESAFCRSRIYLVKNRLYIVQALGSKQQVQSREAERFLDSFEFEKDDPPAQVAQQADVSPAAEKPAPVDPPQSPAVSSDPKSKDPAPAPVSPSTPDADQPEKKKNTPSLSELPREVTALQVLGRAVDVRVTTRPSAKKDLRLNGLIRNAKDLAGKDLHPGLAETARQLKQSIHIEYLIVTTSENPSINGITDIMGKARSTKIDKATIPGQTLTWHNYFWIEFGAVSERVKMVRVR